MLLGVIVDLNILVLMGAILIVVFTRRLEREQCGFCLDKPFLSIVIPAHNEEVRLPVTLQQVAEFTRAAGLPHRSHRG